MLALAPPVSKCVMIGDKRKFNVMLISLKQEGASGENAGNGKLVGPALELSPKSTTTQQAMDDPVWVEYLSKILDQVNKDGSVVTSHAYRVEKFMILPFDFSQDGGELTATLKLKRSFVDEKYKKAIDSMYAESATGKYVKYVVSE